MRITIHGHSDDLVVVYRNGTHAQDFYTSSQVRFVFEADETPGGVIVTMHYNDRGLWTAEVEQTSENNPIPWPVTIGHHKGTGILSGKRVEVSYSVEVIIEIPESEVKVYVLQGVGVNAKDSAIVLGAAA